MFAAGSGTGARDERGAILTDQPQELREYLAEARAVAEEWYSREGVEGSHESNIEMLAVLMGLTWVLDDRPFSELREAARVYLVAAFQMGRATRHG